MVVISASSFVFLCLREAVWRGVFGGRWPLKPLRKLWPLAAATAATADLPIHVIDIAIFGVFATNTQIEPTGFRNRLPLPKPAGRGCVRLC